MGQVKEDVAERFTEQEWETAAEPAKRLATDIDRRAGLEVLKGLAGSGIASTAVSGLDPKVGIGGAPTRATTLPSGAAERKTFPIASGVLDYFPDALVAIANISYRGNEQHNPGQPLHWARGKSGDEADTLIRHFLQRGTLDTDGVRHSAKMAWRALALLQKEIEQEGK